MGEVELGLFTAALGLSAPWRVTRTEFDGSQLDLYLEFPRGARFPCPAKDCTEGACVVHDTAERTWRHMDFFQYKAFLHARLGCPAFSGLLFSGLYHAASCRFRYSS